MNNVSTREKPNIMKKARKTGGGLGAQYYDCDEFSGHKSRLKLISASPKTLPAPKPSALVDFSVCHILHLVMKNRL